MLYFYEESYKTIFSLLLFVDFTGISEVHSINSIKPLAGNVFLFTRKNSDIKIKTGFYFRLKNTIYYSIREPVFYI